MSSPFPDGCSIVVLSGGPLDGLMTGVTQLWPFMIVPTLLCKETNSWIPATSDLHLATTQRPRMVRYERGDDQHCQCGDISCTGTYTRYTMGAFVQ